MIQRFLLQLLLPMIGGGVLVAFLMHAIDHANHRDRAEREKLFAEKCLAAHYSREQCEFFLVVSEGANSKAAADAIFSAAVHAATTN
jgi:hypothetical protein